MKIREIREKTGYDQGKPASEKREFVQSWEFGDFLQSVGRDIRRFEIPTETGTTTFQGVFQKHPFRISYLYIPRVELTNDIALIVCKGLKEMGYTFIRVEPLDPVTDMPYRIVSTYNRQPEHSWLLNVSPEEETLLAQMHPKTRYNIRLAEKKGVRITEEQSADFFWKLNEITVERDGFKNHNREYFTALLSMPNARQLVAWYEGVPIAAIILFWYGETMYYFYGASANEYRNVMAPYLLQWYGIRFAKERGCRLYDFWGIAEPVEGPEREGVQCLHELCWNATQPLSGVTRFKAGFGGFAKSYPRAIDVVLDPMKYGIYRMVKKFL